MTEQEFLALAQSKPCHVCHHPFQLGDTALTPLTTSDEQVWYHTTHPSVPNP